MCKCGRPLLANQLAKLGARRFCIVIGSYRQQSLRRDSNRQCSEDPRFPLCDRDCVFKVR